MTNATVILTKATITKSVEALLDKYGDSIEAAENYKQVYNTKSGGSSNNVDSRVLSDSFNTRKDEVLDLMREFFSSVSESSGVFTVTLSMPDRWAGKATTLTSRIENYIKDGMMADWLNVTMPNEAAIYITRLQSDVTDLIVELYSKGAPS